MYPTVDVKDDIIDELNEQMENLGSEALYKELIEKDPEWAKKNSAARSIQGHARISYYSFSQ